MTDQTPRTEALGWPHRPSDAPPYRSDLTDDVADPTPTTDRWVESLADDAHGLVWTTKAELRQVLAQARTEALDVEKVRTALHATCQPSQCTLPSGYEEAVVRAILAGETK